MLNLIQIDFKCRHNSQYFTIQRLNTKKPLENRSFLKSPESWIQKRIKLTSRENVVHKSKLILWANSALTKQKIKTHFNYSENRSKCLSNFLTWLTCLTARSLISFFLNTLVKIPILLSGQLGDVNDRRCARGRQPFTKIMIILWFVIKLDILFENRNINKISFMTLAFWMKI